MPHTSTRTLVVYNTDGGKDQVVETVTSRDPHQAAREAPAGARTFYFVDMIGELNPQSRKAKALLTNYSNLHILH